MRQRFISMIGQIAFMGSKGVYENGIWYEKLTAKLDMNLSSII